MSELTTCLWFDTEGEAAARFYVDVFPNSRVNAVTPYPEGEREGQPMTVDFVLNGQKFVALNGGPSSASPRPSRSRSRARTSRRSTATGTPSSPVVARKGRAAGSRTGSDCPGRWCPTGWSSCCLAPSLRWLSESPRRCMR